MSKPKKFVNIQGRLYRLCVFGVKSHHDDGTPKDLYRIRENESVQVAVKNPETGELEGTDAEFITGYVDEINFKR